MVYILVYINAAHYVCTIKIVEVELWLNDIMLHFFNISLIHSHAQILACMVPDSLYPAITIGIKCLGYHAHALWGLVTVL